jgi:hypothetical protein
MIELIMDALDPGISRFQLYLATIITLLALLFTVIKAMLAERDAQGRKKVLSEMREYKEKVRRSEAKRHQEELKKWETGEDWPIGERAEKEEPPEDKAEKGPKAGADKNEEGGGPDAKE